MAKHERSGSNLDNIPDTPLSPDVALSGSKSHIATPGKEYEAQIQALKDEIRETEQKVKGFRQKLDEFADFFAYALKKEGK